MGNQDALPDAILELVLLGLLDSPLCLHRAASTCKRWRRIIASDAFRRPSVVAGSYYNEKGALARPRFEPSPSAAGVDARHFSLEFVPDDDITRYRRRIKDSRGSLLLLSPAGRKAAGHGRDLIVYEPLTRRHEAIPPPPSLLKPPFIIWNAEAALLYGGGGVIGMSNFRVLVYMDNEATGQIRACMFTSGSSSPWRETSIDMPPRLHAAGFAGGRRYWHDGERTVVVLDQSALKFSSFTLPHDDEGSGRLIGKVAVVVGRDGEPRIVVDGSGNTNTLKIFARQKGAGAGGEGAEAEWALEKTIQLSAAMLGLRRLRFYLLSWEQPEEAAGMVRIRVLQGAPETSLRFHLDMETMEAERLPGSDVDYYGGKAYPIEFPWPPSSLRAGGTEHSA